MNYNQFIESESGLKDALFDLFKLDVDKNKLELKSVEVTQPALTYNECMVLQESYSYSVRLVTHFVEGPEIGREFEATVFIPKMCERGFLIKGLQDNHLKWRAPVNYGTVKKFIGCRRTIPNKYIFIQNVCSIYPFKSGKNYIPRIELNEYVKNTTVIKKFSLEKYLSDSGFTDIIDIIGGPNEIPDDYIQTLEEIKIPKEISEKIENKYFQLVGEDSDMDKDNPTLTPKMIYNLVKSCIDNPEIFDTFTPMDIEFSSFHTTLFTKDIYKYKLIKSNLSSYLTKYRALNQNTIQKAISSTFNMLGNENAVQAGALSNALSFISQTNKVYFKDWRNRNNTKEFLRYTDDFYGIICPCKTPESVGLCGIKNEFTSSVRVSDDEVLITVLTKSGELKELKYIEYFKSKILLHDSYDYVNNVTIPNKYGKLKIIHKGRFGSVENSLDNVDYILSNPEAGVSFNAGLIPFLNRCDGTRLSMATAMSDQAVPIVGGRRSIVTTKLSSSIYQKSDLNWKSDYDGVVEDIYKGYIKIRDDKGEVHVLSIPYSITSSTHSCNIFNPAVKVGDRIKKGDVLMESNSFKDKHLALTVPLKVAFTNFSLKSDEDAFVISDRAAELLAHEVKKEIVIDIPSGRNFVFDKTKILNRVEIIQSESKKLTSDEVPVQSTSKGLNEFGLPIIGSTYRTGELLAIALCESDKEDPKYELARISEVTGDDLLDYYDPLFIPVPYGVDLCKIESVQIFYKSKLKDNPTIKPLLDYYDNQQKELELDLANRLGTDKITRKTYDLDSDKYAPELKIIIRISAINPMKIGDKISNRYGGKGTISAILPYDEMPRIGGESGERVDICVPVKSVVNRKNFSQAYEGNLADLSKLAWKMNSDYIKNGEYDMVRDVLNHLYLTEKFSNYSTDQLVKFHNESKDYYTIEVDSIDLKYTNEVFIELNKYFNYNTSGSPIYVLKEDDYGPRWIRQTEDVTHGTIEFERLHFMPEDKAKATSALGYNEELVMGVGKGRSGGQRIGQMEVWALIGYDTLNEFHQLKKVAGEESDSSDYTANSVTTQMLLIGLLQKS